MTGWDVNLKFHFFVFEDAVHSWRMLPQLATSNVSLKILAENECGLLIEDPLLDEFFRP